MYDNVEKISIENITNDFENAVDIFAISSTWLKYAQVIKVFAEKQNIILEQRLSVLSTLLDSVNCCLSYHNDAVKDLQYSHDEIKMLFEKFYLVCNEALKCIIPISQELFTKLDLAFQLFYQHGINLNDKIFFSDITDNDESLLITNVLIVNTDVQINNYAFKTQELLFLKAVQYQHKAVIEKFFQCNSFKTFFKNNLLLQAKTVQLSIEHDPSRNFYNYLRSNILSSIEENDGCYESTHHASESLLHLHKLKIKYAQHIFTGVISASVGLMLTKYMMIKCAPVLYQKLNTFTDTLFNRVTELVRRNKIITLSITSVSLSACILGMTYFSKPSNMISDEIAVHKDTNLESKSIS